MFETSASLHDHTSRFEGRVTDTENVDDGRCSWRSELNFGDVISLSVIDQSTSIVDFLSSSGYV